MSSETMNETAEAILSIERLTLALPAGADRPFAAEEVSLALQSREILCVVGESGSRKSVCAAAVMGCYPRKFAPPEASFASKDATC